MIKKTLSFLLILIVSQNLNAQKAVYQLPLSSQPVITNPTFFYTVPKTAFKVDVVITKTNTMKGIYADYAEKLLGIANYCKENAVSYDLKKISITPFTVPDKTLQFVAELSTAQMNNKFLETLFAHNANAGAHLSSTKEQNNTDFIPDFFNNYADVITQQTYETYTETKIIEGVVTQVPVIQTKVTTKTSAQQAQEAAGFIEKIREDRYAIQSLSQEITLSKEAFEYLVNQLNELEKKYLELFTGITVFEDLHETFVVYPDNSTKLLPLCSVSPKSGFSATLSATAAHNYYLKCTPQYSTDLQTTFNESLVRNPKYKNSNGYCIRKAAPVFVSLIQDNTEEMLGVFPIYQFGLLETLPAGLDKFEIEKWGYIY